MNAKLASLSADLASCCPPEPRLAARLGSLSEHEAAQPAVDGLARALARAVEGRELDEETRARVAGHLYELMNGGYLSRRALERTLTALEHELLDAGCDLEAVIDVRDYGLRVAREPKFTRTDWW
jgi:hypothetical protein